MKVLLTLIFVFVGLVTVLAQQANKSKSKLDSLERVIATTKVDTVKGRTLCRLCREFELVGNFEAGLKKGAEGLALVEKEQYPEGIASCLMAIGNIYYAQGDYLKALDLEQKSLKIYRQIGNHNSTAACLINIGLIYWSQGNYPKALDCFHQSLQINEQIGNERNKSSCLINMGLLFWSQGNYPKALECFQKSLQINEQIGNQKGIATCLNNLGSIYKSQKNYSKSLEYYQKSLKIFEQMGDHDGIAVCLLNIGIIYKRQQNYTQALDSYQKSLNIFERIGDQKGIADCLQSIGNIYTTQKNYDKSLENHQKSLKINQQIGDTAGISSSFVNIGQIYILINQAQTAKEYALKGLLLAQKINHLENMLGSSRVCYQADSALGDWNSAFQHLQNYKQYSDSLTNEAKSKEFGRLEAQYEYDKQQELQKKQAELNGHKEQERRLRMNYSFGTIIGLVLILTGFFYYRFRTKAKTNRFLTEKNNDLAAKNEEISTQRDELSAQADQLADQRDQLDQAYHQLKELDEFKEAMSGMIVHDLKNPLSVIIGISNKDMISTNDQIAIRQAGKQMLNLTLNILDVQKFEQAEVPLNRRDEALSAIVQDAIEQVSLLMTNKNLQLILTFEMMTGVHADFELISRVLMNLLTNAIKYTPNNGKITIGAEEIPDNQVKISISDTGQGIPPDKINTIFDKFSQIEAQKSGGARSTGLGLTFCKMTVEAHGGKITVQSKVGEGTTFYLTLPKSFQAVKAVQTITLPINEATEIHLTAEDQILLQPFLLQLRALDVYEAGDILKIISQIPDSPALSLWKSELERTIFASNQERYDALIHQ